MTTINEKIKLLNKLLDKSSTVIIESSNDPDFKSWKNLVERTFIKVFGKNSTEFKHFIQLQFYFPAMIWTESSDYSDDNGRVFRQDFNMLKNSIKQYIEEFEEQTNDETTVVSDENNTTIKKVFISHAHSDAKIVEELIELLESIGLESNQIFCTSFEGYGIGLGENFLNPIKDELLSEALVLFLLSDSFYKSPVCLCEMGATWVLAKEHIPIIVPPLDYNDIKGVIPLTQGLKINESLKLNSLKEKIESLFCIQNKTSFSTWERKRDRIVTRIEKAIND